MGIRRELLLIVILIVIVAVLAMAVRFFNVNVVEADASNFVMEDLQSKYPYADIGIMAISSQYNEAGGKYFEVKAKVTAAPETKCPERSHIYYNYPAQNFVPQPPEVITKNCVVCSKGICNIAFPEEAIIASHTFEGTENVRSYLQANQNAIPYVNENNNSWEVVWNSQTADSYYAVTLHRNGTILGLGSISKS
ncbi:hypothetical protein KKE92_01130 [Candidatus Micrarchaeota archaeon]|nr:hypothetical protein [Candidatus Micrarchaeota archaeon]MBU1682153.1 hypothetical protein [Candidatus Micrarchaeota archaeon]